MADSETETGAPPRTLIIIAAALAVALAVAVAVFGLVTGSSDSADNSAPKAGGPLPLVPVPAPQAGAPACTTLLGALPAELLSNGAKLARRELANPAPPATVAWGDANPIVLRCGLDRPPELNPSSPLRLIDGVKWLVVPGEGTSTWYVVDREVYAALTVPDNAGTGPLQDVSATISKNLGVQPLRFG
ncbi:DUF3515 domain-containing protein [Amycolatopsis anabasis]|uniref:DUF3515 domain-containing protein n=1 Tax=Amycolatopsis anabasis TaxID=1840409 RepID=UPI00131C94C9|nr:DUF3515 domain-containing protein [Amycolatopsis anabasis]